MMIRRLRESSVGAYLLLAALVLSGHGLTLRSAHSPGESALPGEGVAVELGEGFPLPGVRFFRDASTLKAFLALHGWWEDPVGGLTVEELFSCPGSRIRLERSAGGIQLSRGEMGAFFKITLGLPLCINRESEEGLTAIPGIGPRIARSIVAERTRKERFRSLDELLSVRGIGPSLHAKIKPYLTL